VDFAKSEQQEAIRAAVREVCSDFPDEYWRQLEREHAYPEAFVSALTRSGWLGALIPGQYGGKGLGISDAAAILEEVQRSGGNASAAHAQMYTMGTVLKHGNEVQKQRYLPAIASGELRLQAFAVTEPEAGL
jgi:acyl-CoA dehydrogenase